MHNRFSSIALTESVPTVPPDRATTENPPQFPGKHSHLHLCPVDMEPGSMSPSDPQSQRNAQRGGMSLADQLRADLVIEFGILIQFPLAEKL